MLLKRTTVGIRDLKTKASEILRELERSPATEVIITRHGKPCAKLVSLKGRPEGIPWSQRKSLRNTLAGLHDLTDADFAEAKRIWEPKLDAGP